MTYRKRIKYNAEQKAAIWDKYKQGESLWSVAELSTDPHPAAMACSHRQEVSVRLNESVQDWRSAWLNVKKYPGVS